LTAPISNLKDENLLLDLEKDQERASMSGEISALLVELNEDGVFREVKRRLGREEPTCIVEELRKGMIGVGDLFERGQYFLSELIMAAEIMKSAMELIKPTLQRTATAKLGTAVIGTVEGDVHTIGKDIVISLLESGGFTVFDLGADVPSKTFVEKVKITNADILGMSTLMTVGVGPMKKTVELLIGAGLRKKVSVMIGGNPIFANPEAWLKEVGADAYGKDAVEALKKAKELVSR